VSAHAHGRPRVRAALLPVSVSFVVLLSVVVVDAQSARLAGTVQWIAGTKMQVVTDSGASIMIDLTGADQSSYRALRNGDAVVVDGYVSGDRRQIIAQALWRDSGRGYWTQSP